MIKNLFLTPFQKFVRTENSAGIILFASAVFALIWANSDFADSYGNFLNFKIGFSFQDFELKKPIFLWINDGLMTIFFFVIGLELKRELLTGEINTLKKASFPLFAAMGGILFPIVLFLLLNKNPETSHGWGIPMATDIAFALAILSTLGKRIPLNIKIFLTAFAIIDDIAGVIVIAAFYSSGIQWIYILYGLILIAVLAFINYKIKYSLEIGLLFGIFIWFLFYKSGIHPTVAGILLAVTIPIKRKIKFKTFSEYLKIISNDVNKISAGNKKYILSKKELKCVNNLNSLSSSVRSPLQQLEHKLHKIIAYFILPIFALANAGVAVNLNASFDTSLIITIIISMFGGKFIGVTIFSFLSLKFKITELPVGVKPFHIFGIAAIAGVGFTMSIFINNLAFIDNLTAMNSSKIGIIIGSIISGLVGFIILRVLSKKENT